MKRSSRNGAVGTVGSAAHYSWLPTATVEEFAWGGVANAPLRIRRYIGEQHAQRSRRVEIDVLDVLRAVCERTEEEGGAVREHYAVIRLDCEQPEVIMRQVTILMQVTTPLGLGGDGYEQVGHISSFGDPASVGALLHAAGERYGASALSLLTSIHTVLADDQLVARVVDQLEELSQ